MIEGLVWLAASVASAVVLIKTIPKVVLSTAEGFRKRYIEQPTKTPPSSICTVCSGDWGP